MSVFPWFNNIKRLSGIKHEMLLKPLNPWTAMVEESKSVIDPMPEGRGLKKSPAMTRLSLNRLRYPGHDTLECFSSSRLDRPVLNSK